MSARRKCVDVAFEALSFRRALVFDDGSALSLASASGREVFQHQRVRRRLGCEMIPAYCTYRKEDVQSLQLALEGARQPRDGSSVTYLHASGAVVNLNQWLLARLEAENAQLRGRVAELRLEIQALRDALGHPQFETQPK